MHLPPPPSDLISNLDHINIQVPPHTLPLARLFYGTTLNLSETPAPPMSQPHLAWFLIGSSTHTIHISSQYHLTPGQLKAQTESPRHLCFKIDSEEKLRVLQERVYRHYEMGGPGAPVYCDEMSEWREKQSKGGKDTGGFPMRFFARDYAGNRIEFTL